LRFSHELTMEQHAPICLAIEATSDMDKCKKFAFTFVGLRSLLNSAIQLPFSIPSGAGGWSLGPNVTYYPIVHSRSAPAFRMFYLLLLSHSCLNSAFKVNGCVYVPGWQDELLPSVVSSMLDIFRAKKASPRVVDESNFSLIHYVACVVSLIAFVGGTVELTKSSDQACLW
jgi:hypothetical protein